MLDEENLSQIKVSTLDSDNVDKVIIILEIQKYLLWLLIGAQLRKSAPREILRNNLKLGSERSA